MVILTPVNSERGCVWELSPCFIIFPIAGINFNKTKLYLFSFFGAYFCSLPSPVPSFLLNWGLCIIYVCYTLYILFIYSYSMYITLWIRYYILLYSSHIYLYSLLYILLYIILSWVVKRGRDLGEIESKYQKKRKDIILFY